jgi:nicotinate-nucleotide pyrophosphorylase (carboxylating)
MLGEIAAGYSPEISTEVLLADGECVEAGQAIAAWAGPAGDVLAAERVALNFLQRLSGIATLTRTYVDAVAGTSAKIYDTRKTTPGWRALEKYAVRAGGGMNHRMGLYDAVLIKDNHIAAMTLAGEADAIDALGDKLAAARAKLPAGGFVEMEVDTLTQLDAALKLAVDVVLLDNMSPTELAEAVARRDAAGLAGKVALEASGGVTLDSVRAVAAAGVERIAIGAITHSATAVDIGLDIELT